MSLINLFLPTRKPRTEDFGASMISRDVFRDFWHTLLDRPTASKVSVSQESALTYSAVMACTRLLSVPPSCLPLNLYQKNAGNPDEPADDREFVQRDDPRNLMVDSRPNPDMIGVMAKCQAFQQQVNSGNAFFEIERTRGGKPIALWPIHYTRVTPSYYEKKGSDGKTTQVLVYEVKNKDAEPSFIPPEDMLHFPYPVSRDGINGKGIIQHARESIGMGLVTERHGASYFGSGGIPRIVVTHPQDMKPDARENFRKDWSEILAGSNVGLLAGGAGLEQIAVSNEDSQFLSTREFNIEEIARWYGVPLHLLQRAVNPGVNNVEALANEFKTFSLMPLTIIWEQELNKKLLTEEERKSMYFRFDFDELLRADSKTRAENIRILIQIGVLTPDEARVMEGLNPVGGAASGLFMQGGMCPIDKLGEMVNAKRVPQTEDEQTGVDSEKAIESTVARFLTADAVAASEQFASVTTRFNEGTASIAIAIGELTARMDTLAGQKDTRETALLAAARTMLSGAVGRMVRNQATAARRAANKPEAFLAFLDAFFDDDHRKNFTEAVEPVASALAAMGISVCAKSLAEREVNQSREELLKLSGECSAKELPERVESRCQEWEAGRAAAVCDSVISGGQAA